MLKLLVHRPIAQIIHVSGISSVRLTSRLSWAAKSERLSAHPRAIAELAKRARGDVRAALHALSFIKARAKRQVGLLFFFSVPGTAESRGCADENHLVKLERR